MMQLIDNRSCTAARGICFPLQMKTRRSEGSNEKTRDQRTRLMRHEEDIANRETLKNGRKIALPTGFGNTRDETGARQLAEG